MGKGLNDFIGGGVNKRLEVVEAALAEMAGLRGEVAETKAALDLLVEQLGRSANAPSPAPRDRLQALPIGTMVRYHGGEVDFPAVVVGSTVRREGFPPRYTLFVIFSRGARHFDDVREGQKINQFSVLCNP